MDRITSTGNKLIREVRELSAKAKIRREKGLFIAEGERLNSEIPADALVRCFVADRYHGRLPEGGCIRIPDAVMDYISEEKNSQGILSVVRQKPAEKLSGDLFMILENLQDPGNLGTIFRTAEAAGVNGILMNRGCADVYSPKVVRSTMGALFRMPFRIAEDFPGEVLELRKNGVHIYAAHLKGIRNHFEFDYTEPTAFMIGNEGNGLSEEAAGLCEAYLRIPMMGRTESLNAAAAATVLMYEALRQRMEEKL